VKTEIYYAKTALLTQPDGKVLIAGTNNDYPHYPGLIQRLNDDGSEDLTFNQTSTLELGNDIVPRAITLDANGRILITGLMDDKLWACRLLDGGSFDSSFGINGSITVDGDDYFASQDISVLSNSKIVITGYTSDNLVSDFKCWRLNEDGSLDDSFGDNGLVYLASGDVFTQGWFLLPDTTNSVIAGGTQFNGSDFDPVIFRILDDGR
jgi:uncharacterized delta-60 repeat protein